MIVQTVLLVLAVSAVAAAALLWPRYGVVARIVARRKQMERIRVEDALKHLYDGEYRERSCGVESLAGALGLPRGRAARLVARLESLGLARQAPGGVVLTDDGRAYALRVVRSHRLWEHYLAEETGVRASDWHARAEAREHTMTEAEAEALATRLGHPLYDPHGDPIPTATGDMPTAAGLPLTALGPGEVGRITHLEDEPPELYERLARAGLGPGMRVELNSPVDGGVQIRSGGRDYTIERAAASMVTVERLDRAHAPEPGIETLADLRSGETAEVVRISTACRGPQRRRLLDLGIVPGTRITAELRSASGDPVAFRIRGAVIALRREQAERILVRRESSEGSE